MSSAVYASGGWQYPIAVRDDIDIREGGDGERLRLVCRWPQEAAPKGVIVFCHGLGSGAGEYAGLSGAWAARGYLVIHPGFPDDVRAVLAAQPGLGGGPDALRQAHWSAIPELRARLYEILHTPHYWLARIRIVRQLMDQLDTVMASTCGSPRAPLPGAIAGHSFGAYTAQLLAGAEIDIPELGTRSFRDERFRVAILLSAQGRDQQGLREGSWDRLRSPMLNLTGTRDGGAKGQDWHWKLEPFEQAPAGDKYLAVLENADHYLGGLTRSDPGAHDPAQLDAVRQLTLAFLDAHLLGDSQAHAWLAGVGDRVGSAALLFRRK